MARVARPSGEVDRGVGQWGGGARVCTIAETFGVVDVAARAMDESYTLCTGEIGSLTEVGAKVYTDIGMWSVSIRERMPRWDARSCPTRRERLPRLPRAAEVAGAVEVSNRQSIPGWDPNRLFVQGVGEDAPPTGCRRRRGGRSARPLDHVDR